MMTSMMDVIRKLLEQEKAKLRLGDMISSMQQETHRYFHNYLEKNIDVRLF